MNTGELLQQAQEQIQAAPSVTVDWKQLIFFVLLLVFATVIFTFITHQSRGNSRLSWDDLLLDHLTNRFSDDKLAKMCALAVSTIVVLYLTFKNALTEWAFGAYMGAWVLKSVVTAARGARPVEPSA